MNVYIHLEKNKIKKEREKGNNKKFLKRKIYSQKNFKKNNHIEKFIIKFKWLVKDFHSLKVCSCNIHV